MSTQDAREAPPAGRLPKITPGGRITPKPTDAVSHLAIVDENLAKVAAAAQQALGGERCRSVHGDARGQLVGHGDRLVHADHGGRQAAVTTRGVTADGLRPGSALGWADAHVGGGLNNKTVGKLRATGQNAQLPGKRTGADGEAVDVVLAAEDRRHLSPGQRAMWRAKVMADAGLRQNGRWKYGSVEFCGSAKSSAVRTDMARAGLILDYLSDVVDDVIAGTVALDDAHRRAKTARDTAQRIAELDDDLAALVEAGTVELDDALDRQALPAEFRQRVNAGHLNTTEALQLIREQDDRIRSAVDAFDQWMAARERRDAVRYSPEYQIVLANIASRDPDLAKLLRERFPQVTEVER